MQHLSSSRIVSGVCPGCPTGMLRSSRTTLWRQLRIHILRLLGQLLLLTFVVLLVSPGIACAQILTVGPNEVPDVPIPPFHPTNVAFSAQPMRQDDQGVVFRTLLSQTVFAVRPLPMDHHGVDLYANGKLTPNGRAYQKTLYDKGEAVKPGDRVVISNVKITRDRITLLLNGGPDVKHRILRHVSIGVGGAAVGDPVVAENSTKPVGARVSLIFDKYVPRLTHDQLIDLLEPLFDFHSKSAAKTFTETLPPRIQDAVLHHQILVGMSPKLVTLAMGRPDQRLQEDNPNGEPFIEWIYGETPAPVQFVRFDGGRVVRLEIADVGKPPIIRTLDETGGYVAPVNEHTVQLGDVSASERNATQAPPTLRKPGEKVPDGTLQRVQMPSDTTDNPNTGLSNPTPVGTQPTLSHP